MISLGAGFLTGKLNSIFIGICIAVLVAIVLPNIGNIASFFGYKTKAEIAAELADVKQQLKIVIEANESLKASNKLDEGTHENTVESIENINTAKEKNEQSTNEILDKKKQALEEIEKTIPKDDVVEQPSSPTPTITINQVRSKAIARIQVKTMWDAFCQFNSTNPQCLNKG